jgi:hypothetical protein
LRPRLTTGLPFSLAHTDALACKHIPSACYECTIHWIISPRNTPWRISPQGTVPPCCFALRALFMPALLGKGDESAMNFEGLGGPFRDIYCFPKHFCALGANVAENRREYMYAELKISELYSSRGRKRNVWIFEPSRGFDTPLSIALKNTRFLCRSRLRYR